MTFAELKADTNYMRQGNEDDLPPHEYSNEHLEQLLYESAKNALKLDLLAALQCTEANATETLNTITETNALRLSIALANKQLELFFLNNDRGEKLKYRYYQQEYNSARNTFSALAIGKAVTHGVSIQNFKR